MIKSRYISTAQLAQFLGISSVAVFKRIQKGQIKAIKIGRSYAIPESYIKEHFPAFPLSIAEEGQYLSVIQAAQILGLSRVAVFKRIKTGKLPAKRVGRHYVIQRDHISKEPAQEFSPVSIEKDYVSVVELANILGVSRVTIFNKIKKGEIKAGKIGRHYAIAREEIFVLKKEEGRGKKEEGRETKDERRKTSEEYLSLIEAAALLNISRIAVFKKVKKGQIKAIRIGRSYAIRKEELRNKGLKE